MREVGGRPCVTLRVQMIHAALAPARSAQTDVLADPTEPAKGELEATITVSCLQLSRKQRVSLVLQLVPS